jgi:hypothetical protein
LFFIFFFLLLNEISWFGFRRATGFVSSINAARAICRTACHQDLCHEGEWFIGPEIPRNSACFACFQLVERGGAGFEKEIVDKFCQRGSDGFGQKRCGAPSGTTVVS